LFRINNRRCHGDLAAPLAVEVYGEKKMEAMVMEFVAAEAQVEESSKLVITLPEDGPLTPW